MGPLFLFHYLFVIILIQMFGGILLFANCFVHWSLTLPGPANANVFYFHALMDPGDRHAHPISDAYEESQKCR